MKLTPENINKIIAWQRKGKRSVKIEIQCPEQRIQKKEPVRIWVFDYDVLEGISIKKIEDLPTHDDLVQMGIEAKKQEVKRLEEQLATIKMSERMAI